MCVCVLRMYSVDLVEAVRLQSNQMAGLRCFMDISGTHFQPTND